MNGFRCPVACATLVLAIFFSSAPGGAQTGACGQPVSTGTVPTATDARYTLLAAIGARVCDLCVCDVDSSGGIVATDALLLLNGATGLDVAFTCSTCGVDGECPGVAQFALLSKIRGACATNADCGGIAICDPTIGRCRTGTNLDIGWSGLGHSQDLDDIVPARLKVECTGPAPCGECPIVGLDPQLGNCRCANDNRIPCFVPHEADAQSCGGEECKCYFGPPVPLSAGNVPTCLLNLVEDEITGLVNVDEGSGTIEIPLLEEVFLGISLLQPCPVCDGDTAPANGQREGTCVGGLNDGESCDAQSENTTFTAPGGARHSLDCFPDPGVSITPTGLRIAMVLGTGESTLDATVSCGLFGQDSCPCATCSGDPSVACASDAECAAVEAGTCSRTASPVVPQPNGCNDGVCSDIGGERGQCAGGPTNSYCDAILRADGRGFIGCNSNLDCDSSSIGVDGGDCVLSEIRSCYLDPIVATGRAHPAAPLGAAAFCTPATSSGGVNSVTGLPGPTRWEQQSVLTLFCARAPLEVYTPGVGGCP
jgi:hypothetical protein